MAITFDFVGSLLLAANLVAIADSVEADASSRQGPRDTALASSSFKGPYADAHRGFADEEDALLDLTEPCRSAAEAWATAWTRAVNDHNDEIYEDERAQMERRNEARRRAWAINNGRRDPDADPLPFPDLGIVWPPRDAITPIGTTYDPTDSFVFYMNTGADRVPRYRTTL